MNGKLPEKGMQTLNEPSSGVVFQRCDLQGFVNNFVSKRISEIVTWMFIDWSKSTGWGGAGAGSLVFEPSPTSGVLNFRLVKGGG